MAACSTERTAYCGGRKVLSNRKSMMGRQNGCSTRGQSLCSHFLASSVCSKPGCTATIVSLESELALLLHHQQCCSQTVSDSLQDQVLHPDSVWEAEVKLKSGRCWRFMTNCLYSAQVSTEQMHRCSPASTTAKSQPAMC